MKRELMSVLLGASILLPAGVDAQRNRTPDRNRGERATQPAPVRANGRIAYPVRARGPVARSTRTRVVYSNRGRFTRNSRLWIRADWGRRVRIRPIGVARWNRILNQKALREILGRRTFDRVRDAGRRSGLRGQLRGQWVNAHADGLILVVTMDRVEVAEFVDFDRDGLIDDAFVIDGRRGRLVASRW